jgi:beta-galactosidase
MICSLKEPDQRHVELHRKRQGTAALQDAVARNCTSLLPQGFGVRLSSAALSSVRWQAGAAWGLIVLIFIPAFQLAAAVVDASESTRHQLSMDQDWLFTLENPSGAEAPAFNDSTWRHLDAPHDWSIEGPFDEKNPAGGAGGFLPTGIGWYRKHFTLPARDAGKRVFIEFDGVMANSDVWINGIHLGHRPYGYVSFLYELTDHLSFGNYKTNVLAVRADNSAQPASRWYAGAGIYRHVRLTVTDAFHIAHWATFVSTPQVSSNKALIHVQSAVTNQSRMHSDISVHWTVLSSTGNSILQVDSEPKRVSSFGSAEFQSEFEIRNPKLWNLDHPSLYSLVTEIRFSPGGSPIDQETTSFGIRDAHFEAATGFWLNGQNIKINGVCLHHDAGALGAAVPIRAWERRLEILKSLGCNAIRSAHNPPAPEFLDLCDRMGFLVMDEMFDCWTVGKNRYDYHLQFNEWSKIDARDTILRDRNHPSIVVYSAGNEIHDTPKADLAKQILSGLVEVFHQNDPTRPVSQALFRPNVSHDYDNGLADLLDVIGQNYRENEILAAHESKPTRKILGTENGHDRKVWLALRDNPAYAGQFLWSGIDYLGESRRWPVIAAGSGLLDRTGTPRPRAFERQSWWSDKPMVYICRRIEAEGATPSDPGFNPLMRRQTQFSDWTPRNLEPHDETVEVYSNCEDVELILNNKSLGKKPLTTDASPRTWKVPFQPGTIKAIARNHGRVVASHDHRTAGKPAEILLKTDRADLTPGWDDVAYIEAAVVDRNGVLVPNAADLISFKLAGPGSIIAVDNGDNSSHEPFQAEQRRAYQGRCFAIIRANTGGKITVEARAEALASGSTKIRATVPRK